MRGKKRKRFRPEARVPLVQPTRASQMGTMDFTRDSLTSGRNFRTLNLRDGFTREAPPIEVDCCLPGSRVVRMLEEVAHEQGYPDAIQMDNGLAFISREKDQWAYAHGVALHLFEPGKPVRGETQSFFHFDCGGVSTCRVPSQVAASRNFSLGSAFGS
jgi:putative transposase